MLWSEGGAGAAAGRWKKGAFLCPAQGLLSILGIPGLPRLLQWNNSLASGNYSPFLSALTTSCSRSL